MDSARGMAVPKETYREPPLTWERWGLWTLLVFFVVFGVLVEYRSAYLRRRMTDLNCYLRASWAVREGGADLYHVFDDNGWHYNYPPLFAILMTPLADPPPGVKLDYAVPFAFTVGF